jgi:DNA-binding FadR family transcriptional regulator
VSDGNKKAAAVARELEAEIMRRGWPIGELLGSEPELIARFGVSRAVLREAVRIVEHDGAAQMRRGPGGGLVVTAPELGAVVGPATLYLDHAAVSSQDLFDVRSSLELACTALATEKLTEEGAARLREVVAHERSAGGGPDARGRFVDLHIVLAELTGNRAMRLFVETLVRLTSERVGRSSLADAELEEVHTAHAGIVEAIIAGDGELAQERMRTHLAEVAAVDAQTDRFDAAPAEASRRV